MRTSIGVGNEVIDFEDRAMVIRRRTAPSENTLSIIPYSDVADIIVDDGSYIVVHCEDESCKGWLCKDWVAERRVPDDAKVTITIVAGDQQYELEYDKSVEECYDMALEIARELVKRL